jgi:hypothetical protein
LIVALFVASVLTVAALLTGVKAHLRLDRIDKKLGINTDYWVKP